MERNQLPEQHRENQQREEIIMAHYVDGFVIPILKKNVNAYRRGAQKAGKIWRDHGALEFRECVGEDLNIKMGKPFTRGIKTNPGETVIFSYIVFKSRAHRDRVNARVMKDPRLAKMMDQPMSFDVKRMLYGGFTTIVEA
jgi:uncharacterized protein YbaA (DUF1428 family)